MGRRSRSGKHTRQTHGQKSSRADGQSTELAKLFGNCEPAACVPVSRGLRSGENGFHESCPDYVLCSAAFSMQQENICGLMFDQTSVPLAGRDAITRWGIISKYGRWCHAPLLRASLFAGQARSLRATGVEFVLHPIQLGLGVCSSSVWPAVLRTALAGLSGLLRLDKNLQFSTFCSLDME